MKSNKSISKFQFITINHPKISHSEQAIRAFEGGCKWVQLRMKDHSLDEIETEINKILPIANKHNAKLLINDHVELVIKTNAHGVHLGKEDMCPKEARNLLGNNYIIGGTANTFEDVIKLIDSKVDYVGLGPFRFTYTKKKLNPKLGYEGYEQILFKLKISNKKIPIIAIGGIIDTDIEKLMGSNIHGIAAAAAILEKEEIEINVQKYQQKIDA